jgi:hypothetical protein
MLIMILDMVFSVDSIMTAVGLSEDPRVMFPAIIIASLLMMSFCTAISRFIEARPTVTMLAFIFTLLIGLTLIAEGMGHSVPKGFIYAAIAIAMAWELLLNPAGKQNIPQANKQLSRGSATSPSERNIQKTSWLSLLNQAIAVPQYALEPVLVDASEYLKSVGTIDYQFSLPVIQFQ